MIKNLRIATSSPFSSGPIDDPIMQALPEPECPVIDLVMRRERQNEKSQGVSPGFLTAYSAEVTHGTAGIFKLPIRQRCRSVRLSVSKLPIRQKITAPPARKVPSLQLLS